MLAPSDFIQEKDQFLTPTRTATEVQTLQMTAETFSPMAKVKDQFLTDLVLNQTLGSKPHAAWVEKLCPQVVEHYNTLPVIKEFVGFKGQELPIGTTDYLARAVCSLSIVQQLASSIGATLQLFAGSHLGALLHGQPIPWDDDIDAVLPFWSLKPFLEACGTAAQVHSTASIHCISAFNAVKIYIEYEGMENYIKKNDSKWKSPYIDLFFYDVVQIKNTNQTVLNEVSPAGHINKRNSWDVRDYFPTQPFYFAGLYVMGPNPRIAKMRYQWNSCRIPGWDHLKEQFFKSKLEKDLDCSRLAPTFPFAYNHGIIRSGNGASISIFPTKVSNDTIMSEIPLQKRNTWASLPEEFGPNLTRLVPHLNTVEVDNSISTNANCTVNSPNITVIEFNAERGTHWLEALHFLKDATADVIILNEMDIGMARTDQQHTTKLMAQMLNMNYAWGLEFVELTNGDKEEQDRFGGLPNFHGLHGNAILTHCQISDPVIFRDSVGEYFSDRKISLNAKGYEKRLGGRMGMFLRINVSGTSIVLGSTHKLAGQADQIKRYIGSSKVISAGDQDRNFCGRIGMHSVDDAKHSTWPASCTKFGSGRGDNICSNLRVAQPEQTFLPCLNRYGIPAKIGDHAFTKVSLALD